jgi:choline dehydrogenase-like flavoprotein
MIAELSDILNKGEVDSEVVIVGSGLAAFAVAYTLEKKGIKSIVFESGTLPGQQEWNISAQAMVMADYGVPDSYTKLHVRRERGGGSSVWGGWCSSLRSLNYNRRDLPNYPAWPITKEELLPSYVKACEWLQIDGGERAVLDDIPVEGIADLVAKPFGFSPPTRYETTLREHVEKSDKITLVTGATVNSFVSDKGRVTGVEFLLSSGMKRLNVSTDVVMAGGAVGNARVIARSDLGLSKNTKSFVGNHFFEHPHCYFIGKVLFSPELTSLLSGAEYWSRDFLSIAPTSEFLKNNGLTDFNFQLTKALPAAFTPEEAALAKNYKSLHGVDPQFFQCTLGTEQIALSKNSVLDSDVIKGLSDGNLRLDLDSQKPIVVAAKKWLLGLGVHSWSEPEKAVPVMAVGHLHGTTRMASAADNGVVDKNCAVFGVDNLYVAGSSIFPTGGFVNPTMTIVALAIRLGEHISESAK